MMKLSTQATEFQSWEEQHDLESFSSTTSTFIFKSYVSTPTFLQTKTRSFKDVSKDYRRHTIFNVALREYMQQNRWRLLSYNVHGSDENRSATAEWNFEK